jgi:hypothetical protein
MHSVLQVRIFWQFFEPSFAKASAASGPLSLKLKVAKQGNRVSLDRA